jgi:hypothetical protein
MTKKLGVFVFFRAPLQQMNFNSVQLPSAISLSAVAAACGGRDKIRWQSFVKVFLLTLLFLA